MLSFLRSAGLTLAIVGLALAETQARPAPIPFIENQGQWDNPARFVASVPGGWLFLENNAFTYNLQPQREACPHPGPAKTVAGHAFRVRLLGANPTPQLHGDEQQEAYHNYFLGNDPARWASRVPLWAGVRYEQVYPGVNLHWHQAGSHQLEYDFEVAAGADARRIRLRYEGLDQLSLSPAGHLLLRTSVGTQREQAPVAWQPLPGGGRHPVACRFVLVGQQVSFALGAGYHPGQPLVIDPTLVFATYSGTTGGESANTTAYDDQGNMFTGGYAIGANFPVTLGAYQTTYYYGSMVLAKFSASGSALLYATYLSGAGGFGASANSYPLNIVANAAGELLVLGTSDESTFPTTPGAYDRSYNGSRDYVLTRFNPGGTALLASTFLGGSGAEGGNLSGIAAGLSIAANGDVLVSGSTLSNNFPVLNPLQTSTQGGQEGVVTRLSPSLGALQWSTYLGSFVDDFVNDVKEAPDGTVYVCGQTFGNMITLGTGGLNPSPAGTGDGFVMRLSATGSRLAGTYLGTSAIDLARFLDFDDQGRVLVGGATAGSYPQSNGVFSAARPGYTNVFVHALSAGLNSTVFSTQLTVVGPGVLLQPSGFNGCNVITAFGRDDCGRLYLSAYAGATGAPGCPTTAGAFSTLPRSFYLAVLAPDASSLLYGTYIGEPNTSIGTSFSAHLHVASASKVSRAGVLYHVVCTTSSAFGTTAGVWAPIRRTSNNDGAAFKFDLAPTPGQALRTLAAPGQTGCAPFAVMLSATGTSALSRYRWTFGDGSAPDTTVAPAHTFATAGTYTVRLRVMRPAGSIGCGSLIDSSRLTITVFPALAPPLALVPAIAPGCAPYSVQFGNASTGPGLRFSWNFGDGSPLDTTATPRHFFGQPGQFNVRLTVTQTSGCGTRSSTVQVPVAVTPLPVPLALSGVIQPLANSCVGTAVAFSSRHNGAQRFAWNFGDGSPVDTTAAPTHTYAQPGLYPVQLVLLYPRGTNCGTPLALNTTVQISPAAPAQQRRDSLDCRQQLVLDPQQAGTAYAWNTGATTPTITISQPGTYRVQVSQGACPALVEWTITAPAASTLPNIVTLNGDRLNETLRVPAIYGQPQLRVYSRWGRLVYQTEAYRGEWPGADAPAGVYYYQVQQPGCSAILKGWVEVLR